MEPDTTLVGRATELEVIERALGATQHGDATVLAISGEPGIGKTRLLSEIVARAAAFALRR